MKISTFYVISRSLPAAVLTVFALQKWMSDTRDGPISRNEVLGNFEGNYPWAAQSLVVCSFMAYMYYFADLPGGGY